MGRLIKMLNAFGETKLEEKLKYTDDMIGSIGTMRRWVQPGSELRLSIEGFIASLNSHSLRISKGSLEDPSLSVPRAARYQKASQEVADQLARLDSINAGLGALITELSKLRFSLAEDQIETTIVTSSAELAEFIGKLEKSYHAVAQQLRNISVPTVPIS